LRRFATNLRDAGRDAAAQYAAEEGQICNDIFAADKS
jgi:hypothetical protein